MKRLKAVIIKEFKHILRDPRSLAVVFIMPLVQILIFGHVLSFDLKKIETIIIDYDETSLSRELSQRLAASQYYELYFSPEENAAARKDPDRAEQLLRSGKIKQFIIIPAGFARSLNHSPPATLGVTIDGSDSNIANRIYQYNERILTEFSLEKSHLPNPIQVNIKMFFNPEISSPYFIIPGLVAVLMVMISALLTSLSIAREKEAGSIHLLFISPLSPAEIILGKTIPYLLVALLDGTIIFLFARFWFGVPFRGSLTILFLFSLIYLICGLSLGILISTVAATQKVAMMVALLATLLPSLFLSGFIFPLESLSPILRSFSYIVPATYFLRIIRGVTLKGAVLSHFLFEGSVLLAMSLFLLSVASLKFQSMRRSGQ